MTKLGPYEVHPAANLFPLIEGPEFDELVQDIKTKGLRQPIILTHDRTVLVDGRNRYRACDAAGVDPVFETLSERYTEQMILDLIVSENIRRRHLSPGQLAMLAADLEPMYAMPMGPKNSRGSIESVAPGPQTKARDLAGAAVGASGRSTSRAKFVQEAAPDLAARVRAGEIDLKPAEKEARARLRAQPRPEPVAKATPVKLTLRTHTDDVVQYPKPASRATFNETSGPGISWASWSWNPVTGCLHGCDYCYAREIATSTRFADAYPVGFTPLFHEERLDAPANTTIPAARRGDPSYKRVFVCSMADLYGRWVPDEWIQRVHESMLASPWWEYLLLTKFPSRYVGLTLPERAWVGTSVDEQKRVRIAEDAFRKIEGVKVKWLSLEPLREPLEFTDLSMFDWVVIGAQTETRQPDGKVAAFSPPLDWVIKIYMQAREAGCRVHFKDNVWNGKPGLEWPNEYPEV